jgi:hypothetical protein
MKHWKIIYKWLKKHLMIQKKERKDWNGMKERKDWNEMKEKIKIKRKKEKIEMKRKKKDWNERKKRLKWNERKDWKNENIEMISLEVFPKVDVTASSVVEVLR